jgi:hypothetical protein
MKTIVCKQKENLILDYSKLKVILIGISKYPDDRQLCDIPNIRKNVSLLKRTLTNKSTVGVSSRKCLFVA